MMRISTYGAASLVWALFATVSQAQIQNPAYSPYLNLTRGGNPALNYYGLVRPQLATANAFQALGNAQHNLNVGPSASPDQPLQTGHRSSFMTHTRFFMNSGGGAGTRAVGANPVVGGGIQPGAQAGYQAGAQPRTPTLSSFGR
jgi:hypothetical protein